MKTEMNTGNAVAVDTSDAAKGGRARAAKLSPEQRKQIAIAAAEKRWGVKVPVAKHSGILRIADMEFDCAVLDDGTRVLTEMHFMEAMGMYRSGALSVRRKKDEISSAPIPLYLAFKNLKPYVDRHLGDVHVRPLKYRTTSGALAHGIPAEIIPAVCEIWLDARKDGVLGPRQELVAAKAEILMRGLARVGIIALVDEATGFQDERARDALAKILEAFVAKEIRKWVSTFPPEFYKELFRLQGWQYTGGTQRPRYIGQITNDLVYARLAPGVLDELKKLNPPNEKGQRKRKFFQHLTQHTGHPKLLEHLAAVTALMKASADWQQFKSLIDKALPKYVNLPLIELIEEAGKTAEAEKQSLSAQERPLLATATAEDEQVGK